ncbi:MAG: heat-inducible transcriptional repressor HrcA, partial [Vicinamibacteria bacterium]
MNDEKLSERKSRILQAVVECYIENAEPVGSRWLAEHSPRLALSSASVRSVMSELGELGYLDQPHTSAGRLPTAKGFRFYVGTILRSESLPPSERGRIRSEFLDAGASAADIDAAMRRACQCLSGLAEQTGLLLAPHFQQSVLNRIELIALLDARVLALFVSNRGEVFSQVVETERHYENPELLEMANRLNEVVHGLTLRQAKERFEAELRTERALYDTLLRSALRASLAALAAADAGTLYIEDKAQLLNQPEFSDVERLRSLVNALEQKERLVRFLNKVISSPGVQVFISSEVEEEEFPECALVVATYDSGEKLP